MRRILANLFVIAVCLVSGRAATNTAASASFTDVSAAYALCNDGDTLVVPSGSATWGSGLSMTKGITLQGAGIGSTIISANLGTENFVWQYSPASAVADNFFRVTGFTFDLKTNTLGWLVGNSDSLHPQNKVRIDHCTWTNCPEEGLNYVTFNISGQVYGVFDHNVIYGQSFFHNDGNQVNSWNNTTFTYGTTNSFYLEDNLFYGFFGLCGGGAGGRYVARYNEQYLTANSLFPWFDAHGNQNSGVYAAMGTEIYGNLLHAPSVPPGNQVRGFHHRGGKAMCFYNYVVEPLYDVHIFAEEEFSDSIDPTTNPEPQHVNDSYYWNNRFGGTGGALWNVVWQTLDTSTNVIAPNVDFWYQQSGFDGSTGVGAGTLADRPSTVTTGVGYWATDQAASSIPIASVGRSPNPALSGTLYKATAPNTWTAYYTPLVYPHPLVSGGSTSVSAPTQISGLVLISGGVRIQ